MAINWNEIDGYSDGMSDADKLALLESHFEASADTDAGGTNDGNDDADDGKAQPSKPPVLGVGEQPKAAAKTNQAQAKGEKPPKGTPERDKYAIDKLTAENRRLTAEIRAKMTESERQRADAEESYREMQERLEYYQKAEQLASHKAGLTGAGYSLQMAQEMAQMIVDGNWEAFYPNMARYGAEVEKRVRAEVKMEMMKNAPKLPAGEQMTDEAKKARSTADMWASFGLPVPTK